MLNKWNGGILIWTFPLCPPGGRSVIKKLHLRESAPSADKTADSSAAVLQGFDVLQESRQRNRPDRFGQREGVIPGMHNIQPCQL